MLPRNARAHRRSRALLAVVLVPLPEHSRDEVAFTQPSIVLAFALVGTQLHLGAGVTDSMPRGTVMDLRWARRQL
ncbi:MAG: hypothetical protein ACLQUY_06595 [Ktedonobacterales bacterium]